MGFMNQKKFLEQYTYALESDFASPSGEPASWAPGYPKHWGQERARIPLGGEIGTLALSPDSKLIAVGIEEEIHVFHVDSQERLEVLKGHTETVGKIRFNSSLINDKDGESQPGSRYMLVSSSKEEEKIIIPWELDEHGKLVSSKERKDKAVNVDSLAAKALQPLISGLITDYGWDSTEKAIGMLDQQVKNALRNALKLHEQEDKLLIEGQMASFGSPTFSPDGKTMVYLSQNTTTQHGPREAKALPCVNLWDVESKTIRHQLLGHTDSVMWAAISPDNLLVASIAWDGTARVWDVNSGACLHVLGPFGGQLWSGAFSPCGKYLAISQGSPKACIHVYNISTEQSVSYCEGFSRWVRSLAWSPDGSMLACGGEGSELLILDPYTGEERMRWRLAFEDPMMRRFLGIHGVQFVDGGRRLIFQTREGTVEVYDFESNLKKQFTRRAEDKIEKFTLSGMVCSSDSKLLVVPDADGVLRIWDM